jgi:Sulfotransferase family
VVSHDGSVLAGPYHRVDRPLMASTPVLVTGMPRSGTTWLARELARARRSGLPGREPMNPREGQFALGGTVSGWTQLDTATPRQARLLRRCYAGRELRTYSRYGAEQWAAPWPWTHTIVKDPFALLSVPEIVRITGAVPVVVYRHAGAALASYRRMGWTADGEEMRRLQGRTDPPPADDLTAMTEFWTFLHERVLEWLLSVPSTVLVSHAELSLGGPAAVADVMRRCGLEPSGRPAKAEQREQVAHNPAAGQLHGFERAPEEVAGGWRSRLTEEEISAVETRTAGTWAALEARRLRLSPDSSERPPRR